MTLENAIARSGFLLRLSFIIFLVLYLAADGSAQFSTQDLDQHGRWVHGLGEPLWFDEGAPKKEVELLKTRWRLIDNDNTGVGKEPLAGDYGSGGETHGTVVRWSPSSGFVMLHVDKCAARVMGFSFGSVIVTPTKLQLIPEARFTSSNNHNHSQNHADSEEFLFVKWRSVPYLRGRTRFETFLTHWLGEANTIRIPTWKLQPTSSGVRKR